MNEPTIEEVTLLCIRAADELVNWLGMSPIAKRQNGVALHAALGAMTASRAKAPPENARDLMAAHLLAYIKEHGHTPHLSVDYEPSSDLQDLGRACAVGGDAWPWKSSLRIELYSRQVFVSTGYRGAWKISRLLPDGAGWLVTHEPVPSDFVDVVTNAVRAGTLPPEVARIEPLMAMAETA